ncbi:MAG TPA: glycosyltransferase, partial [Patescibacteria group bacterium]|nr:glycosyltransferase [Patescibacteria group bacterium]
MPRRVKNKIKLISVIIPAYKQERTIIRDVTQITTTLKQLRIPYEIIVVIDGMIDKTYEKLKRVRSRKIKV